MASVTSTSSLGNTSLRGYGGMASGIDRDEIIEQMTLGTTTKITNQEKEITKLEWKQEAYRSISDKILDLYDNFSSYTSPTSLKDPNTFAKNLISVLGKEEATRFITATGSSQLVNSVSVQAVRQLATSSVYKSDAKQGALTTNLKDLEGAFMYESKLMGRQLRFGIANGDGTYSNTQTFTMPTTYKDKDENGNEVTKKIDYFLGEIRLADGTTRLETEEEYGERLAKELNKALEQSEVTFGTNDGSGTTKGDKIGDVLKFEYKDGKMNLVQKDGKSMGNYVIQGNSTALGALGYKGEVGDTGLTLTDFNNGLNGFKDSALVQTSALDYLAGKKLTFNYDGSKKDIELITSEEAKELLKIGLTPEKEQEIIDQFELDYAEGSALRDQLIADVRKDLENTIKADLSKKLEKEIRDQLKDQLRPDIEQKVEDNPDYKDLPEEEKKRIVEAELEAALKTDENKEKIQNELKTKLEAELAKPENTVDGKYTQADIDELVEKRLDAELESRKTEAKDANRMEVIASNVQERLDRAFGKGVVLAEVTDGKLSFKTSEKSSTTATSTISITSSDPAVLYNLGIVNGASNKVNLDGKLNQSSIGIDMYKEDYKDGLVINGVTIGGIDANTSISSILSKINSNEDVGVKATYVDATGQFMLVSNETGAAREITLDSKLAQDLFGMHKKDEATGEFEKDANGNLVLDNEAGLVKGQDAIIDVSYGNGVTVTLERASNTFNLEGMEVTVSGTFGGEYKTGADGKEEWIADTSEAVKFSAKADVDKVVEKVKKFFEDFNAIVTEVNSQVTSRPDSSYGPLTDEQKDEMSETSIENWEKKAKSGLLFNDSTMRSLSMDIQSVYTKLMQQTGLSYEDLKEMGITYSDNEKDGGVIAFDETAFRTAMESKPEKVSALFTGGGGMGNGLVKIVEDTFTPYATRFASRNGNSYGRLIEEAGSEKIPTSLMKNQIYKEIKSKQDLIEQLRAKLKTEQDRYISQFTTMETMINKMNSQASYLSQIMA
ncbi:MAG: flagellar filament capping protein FliD [Lachnospiraceae bacterium]|nr:flagellar filament capping protein FliD [Lachnospiraceae bacterium]